MVVQPRIRVCQAPWFPVAQKYGRFDCTGKFELLMFKPVMELAVMLKALLLVWTVAPLMLSVISVTQVRAVPIRILGVALHGSVSG